MKTKMSNKFNTCHEVLQCFIFNVETFNTVVYVFSLNLQEFLKVGYSQRYIEHLPIGKSVSMCNIYEHR